MPELPEVETTRRGISPHILNKTIQQVIIRHHGLRWPVDKDLPQLLQQQSINTIERRGKYLIFSLANGSILLHLGMSGSLAIVNTNTPIRKHDHVDIVFNDNTCLRFHDPRRFGAIVWTTQAIEEHDLLKRLGPEPLTNEFNADYLWQHCHRRTTSIKQAIMNAHIVVGVGNIYASEALFLAGIRPQHKANKLSRMKCRLLVDAIKQILHQAIQQGGTTLKDFLQADGQAGYFTQSLCVYGREGLACEICNSTIKQINIGQRSSYFCPKCQQ
ncbi:MAG: bifunctional DNA-formamidopyrimidine glycosylase/DNA-(apurinic or apyrimidinic site) lyase [Gammaproteobacteria bacterium]|nr:bifunctional DNA-formamidopyrimidine glycosylase/DNA-(apurinic or apyrimidinic site) lyase [Gammaproteobacteria bacterium]